MQVITAMTTLIETYNSIFSEETADARTNNWPLVSGSWKIRGIIFSYLCCIYIILPIYMRNRKPYNLKRMVLVYNAFQIISCSLMVYSIATSGWTTHYTLGCQPIDYSVSDDKMAVRMATYVWWHMILKIVDLIETAFYVLRKKFNQVSVLHVYHHIFVVYEAWMICKYIPGGMATFTIPVNSSIHVLMYSYYLLAAFGPEMQERLRAIKPKLTAFQIIQLTILTIHSLQAFSPSCQVKIQEKWTYVIYVINLTILIILFLKFYIKSFSKKQKHI